LTWPHDETDYSFSVHLKFKFVYKLKDDLNMENQYVSKLIYDKTNKSKHYLNKPIKQPYIYIYLLKFNLI
jgi:hypothetical protein